MRSDVSTHSYLLFKSKLITWNIEQVQQYFYAREEPNALSSRLHSDDDNVRCSVLGNVCFSITYSNSNSKLSFWWFMFTLFFVFKMDTIYIYVWCMNNVTLWNVSSVSLQSIIFTVAQKRRKKWAQNRYWAHSEDSEWMFSVHFIPKQEVVNFLLNNVNRAHSIRAMMGVMVRLELLCWHF